VALHINRKANKRKASKASEANGEPSSHRGAERHGAVGGTTTAGPGGKNVEMYRTIPALPR
jgi:hypothetical protein